MPTIKSTTSAKPADTKPIESVEDKTFRMACEYLSTVDWASWIEADKSEQDKKSALFQAAYKAVVDYAKIHDEDLPEDTNYSADLSALRTKYNVDAFEKDLAALNLKYRRTVVPPEIDKAIDRYAKLAKGFGLQSINTGNGEFRKPTVRK